MRTRQQCCFTGNSVTCECSVSLLSAVPGAFCFRLGETQRVAKIVLRPPGRGVRGYMSLGLAGVDVEAEDCDYLYRLVAAIYRAKFPTS
jgi:hypothetical protein